MERQAIDWPQVPILKGQCCINGCTEIPEEEVACTPQLHEITDQVSQLSSTDSGSDAVSEKASSGCSEAH